MTIAISTNAISAISGLGDLIAEIRDEMDDAQFDRTRILRAIARAEARFNRDLRTPEMETAIMFAVVDRSTPLPDDFLQMRSIGAADGRALVASSIGQMQAEYGLTGGIPLTYAIEGTNLIIAPDAVTVLPMNYYAAIPSLTDSNPANWLLVKHPDLYLHQTLAILFNQIGDTERAATNLAIADDLVMEVQGAAVKASWGSGPLAPRMVRSVRGVIV